MDAGVSDGAEPGIRVSWWPPEPGDQPSFAGVTVATVNYNTRNLVAFLLWSIHRFIGSSVGRVVVVDNGSDDGSLSLLRASADAGLCELIVNAHNRYHGPALTQAVSYIADAEANGARTNGWIWLLDSDCVIARGDVVQAALSTARRSDAALLGEERWDEWHQEERLATFSLLFDARRVWHPPTEPFVEDGDPARAFELSCRRRPGLGIAAFPFSADGYVIHRGRGTLAQVETRAETSNRYHAWSRDHHEAHYERVEDAAHRYQQLRQEFTEVVGGDVDTGRFLAEVRNAYQPDNADAPAPSARGQSSEGSLVQPSNRRRRLR